MVGHQTEKSHVKTFTIRMHIIILPGSQAARKQKYIFWCKPVGTTDRLPCIIDFHKELLDAT